MNKKQIGWSKNFCRRIYQFNTGSSGLSRINGRLSSIQIASVFTSSDSDGIAIVNADTNEYARIKEACNTRGIACWGYGQNGSEINLISREVLPHGQVLNLEVLGQKYSVMLPLVGEFQAMNALCALGLVLANTAFQTSQIVDMLGRLSGVPGRLQQYQATMKTTLSMSIMPIPPDALDNILKALRPHTTGRLICLFGCGDRDTESVRLWGEISTRLADVSIVTDDNPRSEDPQKSENKFSKALKMTPSKLTAAQCHSSGRPDALLR